MTIDLTSYRSISNLTTWLVRFSIIGIILSIVSMAAVIYGMVMDTSNDSSNKITNDSSNNTYGFIDTFPLIILIPIIIITLIWYHRATKNIHSFGAKEVTSPTMAVVWWFIPIANLWKPYKLTQQIWKASIPETKLLNGTEWKNMPTSNIVKLWWVLMLVSVFGSFSAPYLLYPIDPNESEETRQAILLESIITIPFLIIAIVSTISFIHIIRQISTWQYQKSLS